MHYKRFVAVSYPSLTPPNEKKLKTVTLKRKLRPIQERLNKLREQQHDLADKVAKVKLQLAVVQGQCPHPTFDVEGNCKLCGKEDIIRTPCF